MLCVLRLVVITFCFNVMFLLDTSAIHVKLEANTQQTEPCALAGGLSAKNIIRRRIFTRRKTVNGLKLKELASRERGPPRTDTYNPTYGFEPYWEFGDWVMDKPKPVKGELTICGAKCPESYLLYGHVCGLNSKGRYKRFATYCHLLAYNCRKRRDYRIIYGGKCYDSLYTYPTALSDVMNNAKVQIEAFYKFSPKTTTNPRNGGFWFGKR